jgi:hypothetical protein
MQLKAALKNYFRSLLMTDNWSTKDAHGINKFLDEIEG